MRFLMQQIKQCRVCGSDDIRSFFDLGNQPFANSLVHDQMAPEAQYPLSLSWCSVCGLVQLNHTANPKELFSQYVWVTSTSSTARAYAETFSNMVLQHTGNLDDSSYVLEIASNDGTFLEPFIRHGHRVLGVDPAENIVEIALSKGVATTRGFFGEELSKNIIAEHGFPRVIMVRNVLPHVANLHDFVKGIRHCMQDETLLVIEVHYAKAILEELHYDSIYHEHLCYFSLKSVARLLNDYGIHIYDLAASPISGGSIVIFATLSERKKSFKLLEYEKQEVIDRTNELGSWEQFAETAQRHKKLFMELLDKELNQGYEIIGYGASARSSTMLNFCSINAERMRLIADKNPMKHKLFTPGSRILIESPEVVLATNPDTVVILAWNFIDEITQELRKRFNFQGNLVIPLPYPPKLITVEENKGNV